jgi:hypothetical protein
MKNKRFLLIVFIILVFSISFLNANQNIKKEAKKRFAMVMGANNGGPNRVLLKYAVSDAKSLIKVLEDMGGVTRDDCILLEEPKRKMFFSQMKKLQQRINKARSEYRRVEVIFYYSGHSDEKNILIGEEKISYKEFRDTINRVEADIRIAILDSCASGAFTRLKGGKKRSPFLFDAAYDMKGSAFMTSSSSNEASQESDRLKGSFFTHYLISGLRGAADMTQDGRITLSEAYQYAFSETLSQTQKTLSGPQHPNQNIQMTGTGDVVMTDIRKSSAVLVIGKNIFGRIFIHNQGNVLVLELNKPYGRNIEIGLEQGKYRIINIREGKIYESKITLQEGKKAKLEIDRLKETDRIDTKARGDIAVRPLEEKSRKIKERFQLEFFGGFSTLNPADLNLRAEHDVEFTKFYYDDYYAFEKEYGSIVSYTKNMDGEFKQMKHAMPFGFRLKYFLNKSIAISLGFEYIKKNQSSDIRIQYNIVDSVLGQYVLDKEISPFALSTEGYIPSIGIHYEKKITRSIGIEGFLSGGPLFADCSYFLDYRSSPIAGDIPIVELSDWGELEEKGRGTGFGLNGGVRMNIDIGKNFGLFLEGAYAFQVVNKLSGPGSHQYNYSRRTWEGDWGIKELFVEREWGNVYFQLPSNSWEAVSNSEYYKIRDFKLDLSGFRVRIGISYRF